MTGAYSRRILEVQGVSMTSLKNHPPADDIDELENLNLNYGANQSRRISLTSEALSCSTNCSSLSSVDDDDFEKESAQTIQHLFDDIDSILYDNTTTSTDNKLMTEECKDWIDQYPHFRVIGKQIIPEEDIGFEIVNIESERLDTTLSQDNDTDEDVKLSVQGKQMDIYIPPTTVSKDHSMEFGLKSQEEIILQHGEYEELIAVDHGDSQNRYNHGMKSVYHNLSASDVNPFKEKLLDLLEDKIWNEVVSWMRPLITEYITHVHSRTLNVSSRTAPPAIPASLTSKSLTGEQSTMRLATAPPRSSMRNDFNGLLTVSSKMLQYRSEKLNSSLPNNPLGVARKNPLKYIYRDSSSSVTNSSRLLQNQRISTAVRLTPLDHSLKKPLNEIKDESWDKNPLNTRPLTAKRTSPSGRVSSSYWNRNVTLPPIQQSETIAYKMTKTTIKSSKYKNERHRKLSSQSPEFNSMQHTKKENNAAAKPFSKIFDSNEGENVSTIDDASTSGSNSHVASSNSSSLSQMEDSRPSSLHSQWELVQTKEMDALNEDSVHTVEPFVTWLLTQVQSNACKAADAMENNRSSS